MTKFTFDESKPGLNSTISSSDLRNNFSSLFQGDSSCLRPTAQDVPNLTVNVESSFSGSYYYPLHSQGEPVSFTGTASPSVSPPSSLDRIDILALNDSGSLEWIEGEESVSPVAKWEDLGATSIPICTVFSRPTMTQILDYQDQVSTEGYISSDCRPFLKQDSGGGGEVFDTGWIGVSSFNEYTVITPFTTNPLATIKGAWIRATLNSKVFIKNLVQRSYQPDNNYFGVDFYFHSNGNVNIKIPHKIDMFHTSSSYDSTGSYSGEAKLDSAEIRVIFEEGVSN